jgi:predicted GH43/DUF377 family glycosyl hydrolase
VTSDLARRIGVHLKPDASRVVTQLFIAGEELTSGASRANPVLRRAMAISDEDVEPLLTETLLRFEDRHADLAADLLEHFDRISNRLVGHEDFTLARRMLLGAYATNEFSIEAAALCNPSIVPHPDQGGLDPGELRFVLSLRAVGEGHLSAIEFRTGVVNADNAVTIDDPGRLVIKSQPCISIYHRARFWSLATSAGRGDEVVSLVLDDLPPIFSEPELEASIMRLLPMLLAHREGLETIERIRQVARSNYSITFPKTSAIGQRVLRPQGPTETHGMEDARFVRFVGDDGSVTYYATYTAFDGANVVPQLLQTDDFETFHASQLEGQAAKNKGMALFPRQIGGRFVALSRYDRESNAIATSSDGRRWDDPVDVESPEQPWELIQIGNCGSPIETEQGWVVITHGVGAMRTYCLGAILLDLDDPTIVRGKLRQPLLRPDPDERDGYVPNVVYSCGAMLHGETIVLPYAHGDSATAFALVSLPGLLEALLAR